MFVAMALSVRLLVYAGLSLFIISGPYLYVVVCVLYPYNLTRQPPGQTPPGRHPQTDPPFPVNAGIHTPCPVHAGIHTSLPSACWDTCPLPPTVIAADVTHPTGMHSCFILYPLYIGLLGFHADGTYQMITPTQGN